MSTKIKKIKIADSYLKLIGKFPLRPIRNHAEYNLALEVMEKLAVRGENDLDVGEKDYLDALDEFISTYDRKHFAIEVKGRTPLDRLKFILAESGTNPIALRAILECSQPLVSMILSGARELSKENIKALAAHFKVESGLFL